MANKACGVALVLAFALLASARGADQQLFYESRPAMGTTFEIYLYAADQDRAATLFEAAFDEINRIEAAFSNYRKSSELSRINAEAATHPVVTDPEVFTLLERAFEYSRQSDGAFDATVGKLIKAWGFFRGAGRYPTTAELAAAQQTIGWRYVQLDSATRTIRFLRPGIEIDLGGIAKGYALDSVAALLRENEVTSALIGSGSSSYYALGAPPGADGWKVQVPDPLNRAQAISTIVLRNQSLSTSGNYEKFFRLKGKVYSHIFDPRTGQPVQGMLQATVVAPNATQSDALSTVAFVLGAERATKLLQSATNTAALFVTDEPDEDRIVEFRWKANSHTLKTISQSEQGKTREDES